ncbi:hypothetical protein Pelo_10910 [Pelomyxa schiedti]|nr:hypothetical protein Pelo_10910 [Pelomyxa schiedti]
MLQSEEIITTRLLVEYVNQHKDGGVWLGGQNQDKLIFGRAIACHHEEAVVRGDARQRDSGNTTRLPPSSVVIAATPHRPPPVATVALAKVSGLPHIAIAATARVWGRPTSPSSEGGTPNSAWVARTRDHTSHATVLGPPLSPTTPHEVAQAHGVPTRAQVICEKAVFQTQSGFQAVITEWGDNKTGMYLDVDCVGRLGLQNRESSSSISTKAATP